MKRVSLFWSFVFLAFLAWGAATISGQNGLDVRITDVERRIGAMEAERLSERLARLEALVDTNNHLVEAVVGGLALLLLERAFRFKSNKS